jgi:hypothetical protein
MTPTENFLSAINDPKTPARLHYAIIDVMRMVRAMQSHHHIALCAPWTHPAAELLRCGPGTPAL